MVAIIYGPINLITDIYKNSNLYDSGSEAYGYDLRQSLSPGVEYDVVVGVGAARSNSNMVVANSSVRTFIPGIYSISMMLGAWFLCQLHSCFRYQDIMLMLINKYATLVVT